ncbi:MAG: hypothetical protein AAGC55_22570 [Myxococcota bacterium]
MKRTAIVIVGLGWVVATAACDAGSFTEADTTQTGAAVAQSAQELQIKDLLVNVPKATLTVQVLTQSAQQQLQLNLCPGGQEVTVLTNQVCLEPILYNCTHYFCGSTLSSAISPNPDCKQAAFQTTACSNTIPEIDDFEFEYVFDMHELPEIAPDFFTDTFQTIEPVDPSQLPGW